jgi:flavin reductase (DIM6/NTAB) family NADH-FMN oxidoreductase RutF
MTARLVSTPDTGVYLVGVAPGELRNAFTAAWVMQVSFDPLLLALSINPRHSSYGLLTEGRAFSINVLKKSQLDLAKWSEGTGLRHVVEGEIDLADAHDTATRSSLLLPLAPSSASTPRFDRSLPRRAFIAVFPLRDLILIGIQIPQFASA